MSKPDPSGRENRDAASREDLYLRALSGEDGVVRLLLVEDDEADAEWIQSLLHGSLSEPDGSSRARQRRRREGKLLHYRIRRVASLTQAEQAVREQPFDLALIDLTLPDSPEEETVSRVRAIVPDLPVVVLTGQEAIRLAIHALRSGAQDYVVKGETREKRVMDRIMAYSIERRRQELVQLELLKKERTAREETQRAIAGRDEFLSIASHELKGPLTALVLHMQVVWKTLDGRAALEGEELDRLRELLKRSDSQVARLNRLMTNLMDLSRIQSGRFELRAQSTDLASLVREIAARILPEFEVSRTPLLVSAPPTLGGMWDPGAIDQVVTNLLNNALKYASGAAVELRVGIVGEEAWIEVEDRGQGIDPGERARIFERFERGGSGRSTAAGMGLGLFISRRIVEAHGGCIDVRSERGKGTTFTVRLPLARPGQAAPDAGLESA